MESVAEDFKTRVKNKVNGFSEKFKESKVAETIEKVRKEVPTDKFLWLAIGVMGVAVTMQALRMKHASLLVGQLAPSLLAMGLYKKLTEHMTQTDKSEETASGTQSTETFSNQSVY